MLTEEQLTQVHTLNNFDYYCSTGSFQLFVIFESLSNVGKPFTENTISFRTWAYVACGDKKGFF